MKCCANLARSASAKPDPVRWPNWRAPKRSRLRLSGTARRELEMKTGAPELPFSFSISTRVNPAMCGRMSAPDAVDGSSTGT